MSLPTSLTQIDAAFLQAELAANGHDAEVADVTATPLPGFLGVMGEVMTLDVEWAGDTGLPSTFIAKCPKDDDMARLMNMVMQSYARECGFYRDLASRVQMQIPECYVNRYDAETDQAILVIEKIDGELGDLLEGCSAERMADLITIAAQMHGQFWMDDSIRYDWIFDWASPPWAMGADMVREHWPALNSARPELMSPELRAAFEKSYANDVEGGLAQMVERPWTLAHTDYELDNIIFRDGTPVIIDWQSPMRSFPGMDVAFLLATAETEELLAEERSLLDLYRRELAAAGGPEWSHDDLLNDLCWALNFYVVGMSIPINEQGVRPAGEDRQHDRLEAIFNRCLRAADRWDYVERMG